MKKVIEILRCIPEDGSPITYKNLMLKSGVCKEILSRSLKYLEETLIIKRIQEKGRGRYEKVSYCRASPINWAELIGMANENIRASKGSGNFDSVQAAWIAWSLAFLDDKMLTWLLDYALEKDKKQAEKILNGRVEYVLKIMVDDLTLLVEEGLSEDVTRRVKDWLCGKTTIPEIPDIEIRVIPERKTIIETPPP